jgi:hypothetical protein
MRMGENPHGVLTSMHWNVLTLSTHDLRLIPLAWMVTTFAEMKPVAPYEAWGINESQKCVKNGKSELTSASKPLGPRFPRFPSFLSRGRQIRRPGLNHPIVPSMARHGREADFGFSTCARHSASRGSSEGSKCSQMLDPFQSDHGAHAQAMWILTTLAECQSSCEVAELRAALLRHHGL